MSPKETRLAGPFPGLPTSREDRLLHTRTSDLFRTLSAVNIPGPGNAFRQGESEPVHLESGGDPWESQMSTRGLQSALSLGAF